MLRWIVTFLYMLAIQQNPSPDDTLFYWVEQQVNNSNRTDLYRWQPQQGSSLIAQLEGVLAGCGVISDGWLYFCSSHLTDTDIEIDVHRIHLDSAVVEPVMTSPDQDFPLFISPDGQWLYVSVTSTNCIRLYRLHIATLEYSPLVNECNGIEFASLSPDGEWFVGVNNEQSLVHVRADGTEYNALFESNDLLLVKPVWMSSETIVFVGSKDIDHAAVYRINADGTGFEQISEIQSECGSQLWFYPSLDWSPDREWFVCQSVGVGYIHVFIQSITGGEITAMPDQTSVIFAGWHPDSTMLLVNTEESLFLLDRAGTELARIDNAFGIVRTGIWLE